MPPDGKTNADIEIMYSIIATRVNNADPQQCRNAAKALYDIGFRLMTDEIDEQQNALIAALREDMIRLMGWSGLPK